MTTLTDRPAPLTATPASTGLHARIVQGLRDAADYIASHPDLPLPSSVEVHYCIPASTDKDGDDEAWRIAGILGTDAGGDEDGSSSEAGRDFGPAVSYRAVYLTSERMAAHYADLAIVAAAKQEGTEAA